MSEPDVTNIVTGSGKLYIAPLGTALPVVDMTGEFPISWPDGWIAVGYTDDGIDAVYTPSLKEIMVDEEASPVGDVLSTEKFHISAKLAEATLANFNSAIAASTLVNHSSTQGDIEVTAGSQALNYVMAGVQAPSYGTNKGRLILVQKAIASAAVSLKIQRKDKVSIPIQLEARKLSGQPLFAIYDLTSNAS